MTKHELPKASKFRSSGLKIYSFFKSEQHKIKKFFLFLLVCGTLAFLSLFIYFSLYTIALPFQIEYREGAAQVMAQTLIAGKNPFTLENQPLTMNNYGIVYELFVLPFAIIFGNTLFVHRAISLLFIVFTSAASFLTLKKINNDVYFSGLCSILIAIILAGRGGLGAFPSSTGAFFFLISVLLPFNRSFDIRSLFISIISSLLAFYTKPYFVLSFFIVASYLFFFVSKKRGFIYSISFGLIFMITFILIRYFLKLYFIDVLFGNVSNAHINLGHLLDQLEELFMEFFPSLALAFLILMLNKITDAKKRISPKSVGIDLAWSDSPFFISSIDYFSYMVIVGLLAFIFILGGHTGNYMTYAYHIVVLPFLLWLFRKILMDNRVFFIAIPCVLINAAFISQTLINPLFLQQRNSDGWVEISGYLRGTKKVLNSPAIVSLLTDMGIPPTDSGQTEYYYDIKKYTNIQLLGPNYNTIRQRGLQYQWRINRAIVNQEFDMLILTEDDRNLKRVGQYYVKVDKILLDMPQTNQQWTMEIWKPIMPTP